MRKVLVGLALMLLVAACGSSRLSMSEYGDRLSSIVDTYSPRAEAAWVEFLGLAEETGPARSPRQAPGTPPRP